MNNLAYMYATLGRNLDEALPLARRAVELRPRNASFLDTLGYVLHRHGDHTEAASVLMQARALRPGSGTVRYHLGLALEALGDKQKATIEFRETLRLDPNTPAAAAAARRLDTRSAAGSRS
jgi:Flp pilus assembly protein TadD